MKEEILSYELREELKKKAWKFYHECPSVAGKANALLGISEAHYWRQREELENDRFKRKHLRMVVPKKYYPGYELDIDHYTCHWIYSMAHMFDEEVVKCFEKEWYKKEESPYLPKGLTIYQFE